MLSVSRLSNHVDRRVHFQCRHLDADVGAELAGSAAFRIAVYARSGFVSHRHPHCSVLSVRRCFRGPDGSSEDSNRLPSRTTDLRFRAGHAIRYGIRASLAYSHAFIYRRHRPILRRSGVPGANPVAG